MLEEKKTAPLVPKFDSGLEFGLRFADDLKRPSLMVVWELMKRATKETMWSCLAGDQRTGLNLAAV